MNNDIPENHTKNDALSDCSKVLGNDEQFMEHELDRPRGPRIKVLVKKFSMDDK
jgi:hypothetical protein